jgi:hypothetical protein
VEFGISLRFARAQPRATTFQHFWRFTFQNEVREAVAKWPKFAKDAGMPAAWSKRIQKKLSHEEIRVIIPCQSSRCKKQQSSSFSYYLASSESSLSDVNFKKHVRQGDCQVCSS